MSQSVATRAVRAGDLRQRRPPENREDSHLGDFIEDKNAILPIDAVIQSNLREATTRTLASLTPREERVLRMRFGIGMNTENTLEVCDRTNAARARTSTHAAQRPSY